MSNCSLKACGLGHEPHRGVQCPACAPSAVGRRQTATERGGAVEPFKRLLEIARARVGLSTIEARLDHLLMSHLMQAPEPAD